MRVRLLAVLLIIMLLTGCAAFTSTPGTVRLVAITETLEAKPMEAVFMVDRNAPQSIKSAAQAFCEQVLADSENALNFTVKQSTNALTEIATERAQLAFVSGDKLPDSDNRIAVLNAPFTYEGYEHVTMTLNSKEVLEIVGDVLPKSYGATPLAGFYLGTNYLISTVSLQSIAEFRELFALGEERLALLQPLSNLQKGFTELGFTTVSEASYRQRLRFLNEGRAIIAEFSLSEMSASGNLIDAPLYFIPSMHSVDTHYLFASSGFWDTLPETSQALLTEAYSRLFSSIDGSTLLREAMLQQEMGERDMLQSTFPESIRQGCADAWFSDLSPDPLRNYLAELISSI